MCISSFLLFAGVAAASGVRCQSSQAGGPDALTGAQEERSRWDRSTLWGWKTTSRGEASAHVHDRASLGHSGEGDMATKSQSSRSVHAQTLMSPAPITPQGRGKGVSARPHVLALGKSHWLAPSQAAWTQVTQVSSTGREGGECVPKEPATTCVP